MTSIIDATMIDGAFSFEIRLVALAETREAASNGESAWRRCLALRSEGFLAASY